MLFVSLSIALLKLYNNHVRKVLIFMFYRSVTGIVNPERLSHLLEDTQLVSGGQAGSRIQAFMMNLYVLSQGLVCRINETPCVKGFSGCLACGK